ncbi:hypothetical protein AB0P21_28120 [Kribbella sp. NPDC056861]|uniref:hypothetical protein n=1 Tax=Kribbella sp. NPDC056861 TaxID=3154857 RepID=UPI003438653D
MPQHAGNDLLQVADVALPQLADVARRSALLSPLPQEVVESLRFRERTYLGLATRAVDLGHGHAGGAEEAFASWMSHDAAG